jgi:hypothetical protein
MPLAGRAEVMLRADAFARWSPPAQTATSSRAGARMTAEGLPCSHGAATRAKIAARASEPAPFPSLPADRPGWRGIVKTEVALPELLNIFCFGESASTARKVLYDRITGTGRLALADHRS